jgi:hypothetical protein
MATKKDPAVNAMARLGGVTRARNLTPEERSEIARNAVNARWDRYHGEGMRSITSHLSRGSRDEAITIRAVEEDAYQEIWRKVQNHEISATCPCDECVDSVMENIRSRYLEALAKIDKGEKLDKGEGALFQLLTGAKANRWTRVYRQACKVAVKG